MPTDLDLHCAKGSVYPGSAGPGLKFPNTLEPIGKMVHYMKVLDTGSSKVVPKDVVYPNKNV